MTVSDACFRLLFRITISVTVPDDDFGWLFMIGQDDWFADQNETYQDLIEEEAKWTQDLEHSLFKRRLCSWAAHS